MRLLVRLVLPCVLVGDVGRADGQGGLHRSVPDEIQCARCSITVTDVARLGAKDGPGAILGLVQSVSADETGRYWVITESAPPMVFDQNGRFQREVGRIGRGPGEFFAPRVAIPLGADSMLVVDAGGTRATVVGRDLRAGRSVATPWAAMTAVVLKWPDEVVVSGSIPTRGAAGWPLHRVSFGRSPAVIDTSFGPGNGELKPGGDSELRHLLTPAKGGGFWSADRGRYHLTRWTPRLQRVETLERKTSAFRGVPSPQLGTPSTPPPRLLSAIREDEAGFLWVYSRVPGKNWRSAWPSLPPGTTEFPASMMAFDKLFGTVIEVIDPRTARVMARRVLDRYAITALPGNRAAIYTTDEDGTVAVAIVALALRAQ